jgi:hypothetical protein
MLEIFIVAYWGHIRAIVIFVEIIVHLCYMFIISPNYLNKLRNALKEFIWQLTLCFLVFF